MLVAARVDLSTADGFTDIDTEEWRVSLALRRIVNRPARPTRVVLTAPSEAWSGSPVSLTATLVDDLGNVSDVDASFVFTDGNGDELGRVDGRAGSGTLQTILRPVVPRVESLASADLLGVNGERFTGWVVEGRGFGRETDLEFDGVSLQEAGYLIGAIGDRQMGIVDLRTDEDRVEVLVPGQRGRLVAVSPGGAQRSSATNVTVAAPGGPETSGADPSRASDEALNERFQE